ncbi:hypothetical protein [Micromonospora zhanjiangensis]|uniref:SPW repeat-containing protein n=1 Tax=Micromonospora zhanjiangensis TaxID=1522057 RepID=A0ABV8KL77_9ACTN
MSAPTDVPQPPPGPEPSGPNRTVDLLLRVAAGLISVVAAVVTGGLELMFATLRVGGHLIGLSVLLAVLANLALSWFAYHGVGRKGAVALPAIVWFGLMVPAAGGTREGDYLLAGNNWVGMAMIIAGAMTFAVVGFKLVMSPPPSIR